MNSKSRILSVDESSYELLTCPKCHEKSLHVHSVGHYQCIFCDFERNLPSLNNQNMYLWFISLVFGFLVLLGGIYSILGSREIVREAIQVSKSQVRWFTPVNMSELSPKSLYKRLFGYFD